MLRLYIVRHGETVWNKEKRLQGWSDSKLSDKGRGNALLLSLYLRKIDLNAIYSSTSSRAYDTAEIIKAERTLEIKKLEQLREMCLGSWEGRVYTEIENEEGERFNNFWKKPHLYKKDSGEDFHEVRKRLEFFLDYVIKNHASGNILIVTHTVTIKIILSIIKNTEIENIWEPPFIHNTSLTTIEYEEGKFSIISAGQTPHLS